MMNSSAVSTQTRFGKNTKEQEEWEILKEKTRLMALVIDKKAF